MSRGDGDDVDGVLRHYLLAPRNGRAAKVSALLSVDPVVAVTHPLAPPSHPPFLLLSSLSPFICCAPSALRQPRERDCLLVLGSRCRVSADALTLARQSQRRDAKSTAEDARAQEHVGQHGPGHVTCLPTRISTGQQY
eukprot:1471969-Rhodomonas_salina.2